MIHRPEQLKQLAKGKADENYEFRVVTEALELRMFKHADEFIDFSTAARIGQKDGFTAEKLF